MYGIFKYLVSWLIIFLVFLRNQSTMNPVFEEFVSSIFEHHVITILHIIFSSSRHLFDNFCPSISYFQFLLEDENVLICWKRYFFDFWIEEIDPSLSALLTITFNANWLDVLIIQFIHSISFHEVLIENNRNLVPMFSAVSCDNLNQFIIFCFAPNTLLNAFSSLHVIPIETLTIISAWNEPRYLNPILLFHFISWNFFSFTIASYGPYQQTILFLRPSILGLVIFALY